MLTYYIIIVILLLVITKRANTKKVTFPIAEFAPSEPTETLSSVPAKYITSTGNVASSPWLKPKEMGLDLHTAQRYFKSV